MYIDQIDEHAFRGIHGVPIVEFKQCSLKSMPILTDISATIESLTVINDKIKSIHLEYFSNYSNLKKLDLRRLQLEDFPALEPVALTLEVLNLGLNRLVS